MLDINFIRENIQLVKKAVLDKGLDLSVDDLLQIDQSRRELISKVDELRSKRHQAAKSRDIEQGRSIKQELNSWETKLKEIQTQFEKMVLSIPNIPSSDSPIGK